MIRLKKGCYCIPLKQATLTILWITWISCIEMIRQIFIEGNKNGISQTICFFLIPLLALNIGMTILGIIGVNKNRPLYLLSFIILRILDILLCLMYMVMVCILDIYVQSNFKDLKIKIDKLEDTIINNLESNRFWIKYRNLEGMVSLAWFIVGLWMYFVVLLYSYYKSMQEKIIAIDDENVVKPTGLEVQNNIATSISNMYLPTYNEKLQVNVQKNDPSVKLLNYAMILLIVGVIILFVATLL